MTYTRIKAEVELDCQGRGINRAELQRLLERLAKAARGRSRGRVARAWCEDLAARSAGDLCLPGS